jgi:hypothetical protein
MNEDLLSGPEPGPNELRAIVSRASRRRWRTVAVAAVVALGAGGGIGYGVSNNSGGAQTVVAGSSNSGTSVPGYGGFSPMIGSSVNGSTSSPIAMPAFAQKLTRLFVRDAGGVSIRGYLTEFNGSVPSSACFPYPRFQAEVSTKYTVGQAGGGLFDVNSTAPIKGAEADLIGMQEQDPVYVVIIDASAGVANLKMTFTGGGSDEMAPAQSWAALAAELPASALPPASKIPGPVGTLQALGANGQVLQTMSVNLGPNPTPQPAQSCFCPPIASGSGASRGGASSGSGTANSGSVAPNTSKGPATAPAIFYCAQPGTKMASLPPSATSTSAVSSSAQGG